LGTGRATHSVAGGRGGEGWKGRLVRRVVAEANIRKLARLEAEETHQVDAVGQRMDSGLDYISDQYICMCIPVHYLL